MLEKIRLACLASGGGTNLQAIIDHIKSGRLQAEVVAVISNVPGAGALERAKQQGLPFFTVNHRDFASRDEFESQLAEIINRQGAQLICLCGFLRILSPSFIDRYTKRIINIHPALLPAFGGKGFYGPRVHQAVLTSGAKESGCTVHFVDKEVDHGPIILQHRVPVLAGDTPDTLAARVLEQEHLAYSRAIALIAPSILAMGHSIIPPRTKP